MDGADLVSAHPSDFSDLLLSDAEVSVHVLDAPDDQDMARVHHADRAKAFNRPHLDAEFFVQFSSHGLTRRFVPFDVSAWKAPTPGLGYPVRAANHQEFAAATENADHTPTYGVVTGYGLVLCVVHIANQRAR